MPVLVVLLAVVVLAFIVVGLVTWAAWVMLSAIFTGLVIGLIGRIIVPGRHRIGVIATIVIGMLGSMVGSAIGRGYGFNWLETVAIEIGAAAVGVATWSVVRGRSRRQRPLATAGSHRVIDI